MKDIQSIFFVVGGVFLPGIYFAAIQLLEERGVAVSDRHRLEISRLENDLLTGRIPDQQFFSQLASGTDSPLRVTMDDFLAKFNPGSGLPGLVRELAGKKQLVLLSDYPKSWLAKFDRNGKFFSPFSRVIYLEDLGCSNIYSAVLDHLEKDQLLKQGECVWVDANSRRTSIAMRRGFAAVIYVDETRLRRDLHLMSIL